MNSLSNKGFFLFAESWYPVDMKFYGRCYTMIPGIETLKNGIFRLELYFPVKVRVFVHNYGVLRTIRAGRSNFRDVAVNTRHMINVEHDIYKMLDFEGRACNKQENYSIDDCILNQLRAKSMEQVGCVTPFGNTKEHICEDVEKGK